jgi:hypothetical protein
VNGDRFDALLRALARRQSRRVTVRQLSVAGAFVSLFARAGASPSALALPARQVDCPPPWLDCEGVCVDLQTDPNHCGECGRFCGLDQFCHMGVCAAIPACDGGQVLCGETCVDLQSDQRNCGWCGTGCQNWERCLAGVCIADPVPECPPGLTRCDDDCVDTLHDDANCGDCRRTCQLFVSECRDGRCVVIEEPHIPGS